MIITLIQSTFIQVAKPSMVAQISFTSTISYLDVRALFGAVASQVHTVGIGPHGELERLKN